MIRLDYKFIFSFLGVLYMLSSAFAADAKKATAEPVVAEESSEDAAAKKIVVEGVPKVWKYGSLMYNEKSLDLINQAIKSHDKNIPLDILLPTLFSSSTPADKAVEQIIETETAPVAVEAPVNNQQFYLRSILYFSHENWAIWMNDKKIVPGDAYPPLSFPKISKEEVVVLWKDVKIDQVSSKWKEILTPLGDGKRFSNNKNLVFDSSTNEIAFILKPNQTLLADKLDIVEGNPNNKTETVVENAPRKDNKEDIKEQTNTNKFDKSELLANEMESKNMKNYLKQIDNLQSVLGAIVPASPDANKQQ